MAFLVQNVDGTIANANAYISALEMRDFWADRGRTFAQTDAELQIAIIQATDYLDETFEFIGCPINSTTQRTHWPVVTFVAKLQGIPVALKESCCILSEKVLSGTALSIVPTINSSGEVVSESVSVGPVSKSTSYSRSSLKTLKPEFPEVNLKLKRNGLLINSSSYNGALSL